ncbi:MAG TPA: M2 family metallopeptidase [Candidatus Acidoferrales bacterium]|jgi:peptidyl-dipeptidase A|nr:M2 family metallopeptidase [Candidatus Acidoferrales bacterium]
MAFTPAISNTSRLQIVGLILATIPALASRATGQTLALQAKTSVTPKVAAPAPTVAEAERFISQAETRLLDLWIKSSRASWVSENFITDDTESISADADAAVKAATAELANKAKRYEKLTLPPDAARKFKLLKLSVDIPAPHDPAAQAELAKIAVSLDSDYGKGTWCPDDRQNDKKDNCKELPDIEKIMANSRNPQELLNAWKGWHAIAPPMRERYVRLVDLANQGAREMGFADVGAMWRSNYDIPPEDFSRELDRLWEQVRPLYVSLHAYVRWKLAENYGKDLVREDAPIPAQLLGNMWSQEWNNIYPLLAPPNAGSGPDIGSVLRAKNVDAQGMVRYAEGFFKSLGFEPLPQTFWERSLFTKPRDREVVCHASAWDIDFKDDLRIKVCVEPTAEDFTTVHHELGHNFYQRAYNDLSPLFQNGANDGFHEAIGDTIALSVTPEYLKKIGLIDTVPPPSADIGLLLDRALDKVAFLPFGLLVDEWRWKVFSGEIKPADYNKSWWELRRKYQGIAPPVARSEADFDPGAKYHVADNVPYARYFLATILQFQFHRALCKEAGYAGPLHRCSIYGNKAAGARLAKMLAMGASRPWPDALEVLTGQRQMDATAMLDYFAPLKKWLDEQNAGHEVGWN